MLEIPVLKKTFVRRFILLSSVCALAMSLPADEAEARRLMPTMPSVEVHFEALEALRQSAYAQGQTPGGWITGPEGKIVSAPVGYPAPAPAPVSASMQAKAPPAPKPPMPKPVEAVKEAQVTPLPAPEPKHEIAKAPPPPPPAAELARPDDDRPKFAPVAPPPPPAAESIPVPESASVPLPATEASVPALSLPPLSDQAAAPTPTPPPTGAELASLPPLTPAEPVPAPVPQDAAAALEKELESLPSLPEAEAVVPDVSADLPEPDMKSLEPLPTPPVEMPLPPLEEKQAEKKEEKKEKPAEVGHEKKPEDRPIALPEPEKKIIIKAPQESEEAAGPSLEELGLPPLPEEAEAGAEPLSMPPVPEESAAKKEEKPPFAEEAKLPEPLPSESSAPVEEVPGTELPALTEAVPPVPTEAMPPEQSIPELAKREETPVATESKKEEGGMFSGLKGMVKGLLGDEEEEAKPAPAPTPEPLAEATTPPAPEEVPLPDVSAPPTLEGIPDAVPPAPVPEVSQSEAPKLPDITPPDTLALEGVPPVPEEDSNPPGLPSIDGLTSGKKAESDALDFVKEKAGVPAPLPPLNAAKSSETEPKVAVNNKPAPAEKEESVEQQLASIPTPPMENVATAPVAGASAPSMQVVFSKTETEVPLNSQKDLEDLARKLSAPGNTQGVSVVAYASGTEDQASIARRVSLSRALAIRAFLIDAGIDNLRINVQAMGNKAEGGNPERADVFVK